MAHAVQRAGAEPGPPTVAILDVAVHRINFVATLEQIAAWIAQRRAEPLAPPPCRQVCTVNPEFIMDARSSPAFAAVLRNADLRVPDGVGVLWAARLFGAPLRERVTGSDGIYRICERAAAEGWRVYFLGAGPGVAERTAAILAARYPGLAVAGCYSGGPGDEQWPEISRRLAAARADVLFVAFGHPKQDFWIARHRDELPAAVALGVGGAFDFVAGVAVRAPRWIQRMGLEWLHRFWREPWRWRRMSKLPRFAAAVLLARLRGAQRHS